MIIVEAHYRAKPGMRDQIIELTRANVAASRNEPGNLSYTQFASAENDRDMFVFERWKSPNDLRAHFSTPHQTAFSAARRPLLAENTFKINVWNVAENKEMQTDTALAEIRSVSGPGLRDRLLTLIQPNLPEAPRGRGAFAYAHCKSIENERDMFVFERWATPSGSREYTASAAYKAFSAAAEALIEPGSESLTIWNVTAHEEMNAEIAAVINRSVN